MNNFKTEKLIVPIDSVQPNPNNPNKQSAQMFAKQIESIKAFGLLGSITVRKWGEYYEILGGEHRWRACKELGFTEIPVENVGEMSDTDANALLIVLNMQGEKNLEQIAKIVEELNSGQKQLLPYTEEELVNLEKLFKFDFSQYNERHELKEKKTNAIGLTVTEPTKILWDKCLEIAREDKKTPEQMLLNMMDNYLAVNLGRAPGETTVEF